MLRWNSDKAYLARLADQGVPIPPTRWIETVTQTEVDAAFAETGSRLARTRIVCEKRSTDRLRATSSWWRSALGTR